jgi:hypothetical protein
VLTDKLTAEHIKRMCYLDDEEKHAAVVLKGF